MRVAVEEHNRRGGSRTVAGVYDTYAQPVRRRPWLTAVIVVATTLAACCAGGSTLAIVGGWRRQHSNAGATGLNQPVRDGKFEFVVRSVSCGHDSVGRDWWRDEPQGQFCVVELTVTNIGTQAQRFADGSQKAFGPQGQLYAADTGAGVVANGNGDAVWNVVNPGNSLAAKVVFDIPVGATISRLELHDSPLSGGVTVTFDSAPNSNS